MTSPSSSESLQTDLFAGISAVEQQKAWGGREVAQTNPIAQVLLESDVPHLDRYFDYLVPAEFDETAQPGTRVRVRFAEQKLTGYVVHRKEQTEFQGQLKYIEHVVSAISVVTPDVFDLAQKLADRYASVAANVLRL
ncbi:MAG: primosomal protein N', partial [Rothia sp. (in: high G+C Gram-positive bacteria)]|nr:primosomal protein N' [Rothia sp. (in: high G+C Gram-positive bacteria)]